MDEFVTHTFHKVNNWKEKYSGCMCLFVLNVPAYWCKSKFMRQITQMYSESFWLSHTLDMASAHNVIIHKLYIGSQGQETIGCHMTDGDQVPEAMRRLADPLTKSSSEKSLRLQRVHGWSG